jgi:nitric oxide synthase oxygenase domain/subunit
MKYEAWRDRTEDDAPDLRVRPSPGSPPRNTDAQPRAHEVFRRSRAFLHDVTRPPIDRDRVAAEWSLMYHWLRHDPDMARVCGFAERELSPRAEAARVDDLQREVGLWGRTFTVLPAEMQFWVRCSWISADRCSGRQHALQQAVIRYLPEVTSGAGMLRAAVQHAAVAMNAPLGPQTVVTVLGPPTAPGQLGQMFATEQLVRAAGHRNGDGAWTGDGGYLDLTDWVGQLDGTLIDPVREYEAATFDTLPMIAVGRDGDVAVGTCPPGRRYFVDIPWPRHPERDEATDEVIAGGPAPGAFACWPAVPLQTNFDLDIAGQRHCVLFNGWYVDEEIAANLLDPGRYAWLERVSAAIFTPPELARLRRTDRLDEYRAAQVEIAVLRAVRLGFKLARRRLNSVGPSQAAFGRFHERYVAVHGEPPPNDAGWTANRFGSRYRHASHAMPHVPQRRGAALVRHWLTFRSLLPGVLPHRVDLTGV